MTDEFDEIASPEYLLKAMREAGREGVADGVQYLLSACQEMERQVTAQGHAAKVLERQETALKEASRALSWAMLYQLAAVVVGGSILLAGAGVAWHYIGKEPREVLYGCGKWNGQVCAEWHNISHLRPK